MKSRRWIQVAAAAVALPLALLAPAPARGATPASTLTAVDLGTLGGEQTVPRAVNDSGQVVGTSQTSDGTWHAFLWDDGVMTDLGAGTGATTAVDVNDRGQVVLRREDGQGSTLESVLWRRGRTTSLGAVRALAVNERGQVAGDVGLDDEELGRYVSPFLWDRGTRVDLGAIPFWGPSSQLVDLNDRGEILGTGLNPESFLTGFLWADGVLTPIGDPRGVGSGVADLSNRGVVVGDRFDDGLVRAFRWQDGVLTSLAGLASGSHSTAALAVNDRGKVAGTVFREAGPERAFLWRRGVVTDIAGPGALRTMAEDLNDRGQVVGRTVESVTEGPAATGAFLWSRGTFTDLLADREGTVDALQISERGHIIGTLTDVAGHMRGLLWTVGGGHGS